MVDKASFYRLWTIFFYAYIIPYHIEDTPGFIFTYDVQICQSGALSHIFDPSLPISCKIGFLFHYSISQSNVPLTNSLGQPKMPYQSHISNLIFNFHFLCPITIKSAI